MKRAGEVVIGCLGRVIRRSNLRKLAALLIIQGLLLPISFPVPGYAFSYPEIEIPEAPATSDLLSSAVALGARLASPLMFVLGVGPDEKGRETSDETTPAPVVAELETEVAAAGEIVVRETLSLAALPVDENGNTVQGASVTWSSGDERILEVVENTSALARGAGTTRLTARAGKVSRQFVIRVKERENESSVLAPALFNPAEEEEHAEALFSPKANLGSPPGQTEMSSLSPAAAIRSIKERAGSANYSFGLPVAALPGRQLDATVGITYNSRVWHKSKVLSADVFTFNNDREWLSPGFRIGYGYLEKMLHSGYGVGARYAVVGPDGTRTELVYKSQSGGINTYEATDGSFAQAKVANAGGEDSASTMEVTFSDGSKILYGAIIDIFQYGSEGKRYPIKITDRNGNIISISYISGDTQGKISSIKDTLGRYINFHYDGTSEKKLVAVTVPGYDGSTTERQTIRFYYNTLTLDTDNLFDTGNPEGTVVWAPTSVTVLEYVYFPGTDAGFKYSYSPYFGTIYKIEQLRGLSASTTALDQTGSLSGGSWAASTEYDYPVVPADLNAPYDHVPKYTTRTDDWLGRTTSSAPVTTFQVDEDLTNGIGTRSTTITLPDGRKTISTAKVKPGTWEDGLLEETKIVTGSVGNEFQWSATRMFWVQGSSIPGGTRNNTRLEKTETENEAGDVKATTFTYDSYNNQTAIKEHDFAPTGQVGTELRRTEITYETNSNWINRRLLRLPKEVKTIVGGVTVSKTQYEYDGTSLVVRGDIDTTTHTSVGTYRGNLTKTTGFSNTTLSTDPNASVTTMTYDVAGNVTEAGLTCCQLRAWNYVKANEYAYPVEIESGDTGQLKTSATYDFNTGLVKTATDENLNVTTYTYDPDSLRLTRVDFPDGAWSTAEFNDDTFPFHVKTTTSLDATRSIEAYSFSNGAGQVFRSRRETANGYLSSEVEFDEMGRAEKTFLPYTVSGLSDSRPGGVKFTEVTARDGLGRALETTLPDNTNVDAFYNGTVVEMTDQAGKSRRQVFNALGQLVRVDEPDASGNLGSVSSPNQPTYYEFDGNGNLKKTTQTEGAVTQIREFKYDSLSRLTHEKQVEATPSLNDSGGAGSQWTGVYKYNTKNLLVEGFDARGVKTAFTYDGLNRIKTVAYTGESGYQTPQVTYTYDEARNDPQSNPYSNKGQLTTIQTVGIVNGSQNTPATTHIYNFDKSGQIVDHTQTIGTESYNQKYSYNLAGMLTSQTYPSGKVVTNTIDDFGNLSGVADASENYVSGITLNDQGIVSGLTLGNGTSESFTYNDRLQMTSQSLSKGAETLQKYEYHYGEATPSTGAIDATKNNGQLGKIESFIGATKQWSQRFAYDELGRLAESSEYRLGDNQQLSYKQVFDYDRFGNLYRKASQNPTSGQQHPLPYTPIEESDIDKATNRFTSSTGTTYDNAGQVTTDNMFRNMAFAYDGNGRRVKTAATNVDASTLYDALGNRVGIRSYDLWRYMIYDAFGMLVAEYGAPAEGQGGVKYIQQDWQGSVRTVTNSNGFVVARFDHQAYGSGIGYGVGERKIEQGYSVDRVTTQGYGLTESDPSAGQQHTWWRKLETEAGRWTGPDPYNASMSVSQPQSLNRYAYVNADPLNYVDPSGLFALRGIQGIDSCELRWDSYWDGERYVPYLVMECSTIYVPGEEPGGGGTSRGSDDKLPFDSCAQFVDWYVKSLNHSINKWRGQLLENVAHYIGEGLMRLAYVGYNRHINNGYYGFSSELVNAGSGTEAGPQGAGVYGHLLFHSGAYLRTFGAVASYAADWYDRAQRFFGQEQGDSEVEGNKAGWDIGRYAYKYLKGSYSESDLRQTLRNRLCERSALLNP